MWVYGQTEVQKDLVAARAAGGQEVHYGVSETALHDLDSDGPSVTFTSAIGAATRVTADVVVGCDGSFGPSRSAVPESVRRTWEKVYPYSWLGILADVAPSTDELIYAWHPDGFAMHSMRSATVSRLYLQVPNDTDLADWSDDRIWSALATRLGHGQDGWSLEPGPITDRSVLPMRSFVQTPMRHGRLFLAGDAAHIVPPTGAKGLNLAIADVGLLAPALVDLLRKDDSRLADAYSDTGAAPRVAVHPLLVVDDHDAARQRRRLRRSSYSSRSCGGSPPARPGRPGLRRTTPAYRSDSETWCGPRDATPVSHHARRARRRRCASPSPRRASLDDRAARRRRPRPHPLRSQSGADR